MSEESARDQRINRIYHNDIPEHIVHELRDDVDGFEAVEKMVAINKSSFHHMFSEGSSYAEIFEWLIDRDPEFKDEYRDELKQLISDWLKEEGQ